MTTPNQARLNQDVTELADAIKAEVDALKQQPTDLDFTPLESLLEQVKASAPVVKSAAELVPALQSVTPVGPVQIPVTAQTVPVPGANVNASPGPSPVDTGIPATGSPTAAPSPVTTAASSVPSASVPSATPTPTPAPAAEPAVDVEKAGEAPDGDKDADDAKLAGLPLYEYVGVNAPDMTGWSVSNLKTSDGKILYTFDGDTAGGKPSGVSSDWELYTGPTV